MAATAEVILTADMREARASTAPSTVEGFMSSAATPASQDQALKDTPSSVALSALMSTSSASVVASIQRVHLDEANLASESSSELAEPVTASFAVDPVSKQQ